MMGSLYPCIQIVVLIATARGESYDGDREDTSAATGAPEEVVGDHSFSLHFLLAG